MTRGVLGSIVLGVVLTTSVARAQEPDSPPPTEPSAAQAETSPSPAPLDTASEPPPLAAEQVASADMALATDLVALGLEADGSGVDLAFHLSGFADFTSIFPIRPRGVASIALPTHQSFYVGNVNLYLSKSLSEQFRMMSEVRFTYLPNGALDPAPGGYTLVNTDVADYTDNNRLVRWGSIIMQRLYLEWTLHPLVVVRGGQFLTPYGIWNVDHGSPAYIPVLRPYAINSNFFPERQTGLEVFGRWNATNSSTFGYHLTVSNGGGPISEYRDFDGNKALGARLYWEHQAAGFFRLGGSGYYGRDTTSISNVAVSANSVALVTNILDQFDVLALAVDVTYKYRGLHLQAEWVSQQRNYTDAGRSVHTEYFAVASRAFSRDFFSWAGYALVAYSLPWYALTPYMMIQYERELLNQNIPDFIIETLIVHGGVTIHPIDAVTFKAEFSHARPYNGGPILKDTINTVQLQAAWAF